MTIHNSYKQLIYCSPFITPTVWFKNITLTSLIKSDALAYMIRPYDLKRISFEY